MASHCELCLVFTASCMEMSHIKSLRYSEAFSLLVHTVSAVAVCCTLSPAPSNQSPLSQATPCWVRQRNNEYTVAEYFIQPAPSIPTLFASWDRGPVLVKVWLLWCSSFMRRCSNWACSSSRVDFFLRCFLCVVIHHSETETVPVCSVNTQYALYECHVLYSFHEVHWWGESHYHLLISIIYGHEGHIESEELQKCFKGPYHHWFAWFHTRFTLLLFLQE